MINVCSSHSDENKLSRCQKDVVPDEDVDGEQQEVEMGEGGSFVCGGSGRNKHTHNHKADNQPFSP